jgi:TniQ
MTTAAGTRRQERRPLPRQVRPVQNETTVSFVQRLAHANHIRADDLTEYLNARMTTSGRHIRVSLQILADAAGIDAGHLIHALPQLQAGPARPGIVPSPVTSAEVRLACRRCMAGRNIFSAVTVLTWTDQNVCLRHQLWTGHGVTIIEDQADVTGMPEVGRAQARHQRLAHHHGLWRVRDCYETAERTIDWSSRESFISGSKTGGHTAIPGRQSYRYVAPLLRLRLLLPRSRQRPQRACLTLLAADGRGRRYRRRAPLLPPGCGQRPYHRHSTGEHPAPQLDRGTPRGTQTWLKLVARSPIAFCH